MSVVIARLRLLLLYRVKRTRPYSLTERRQLRSTTWNKFESNPSCSRAEYGDQQGPSGGRSKFFFAGTISAVLSLFGLEKQKLDDDEIKNNIRHALLASERKDFQQASDILHSTLAIAQDRKSRSAENYVIDLLANLHYQFGHYDEAEASFTELMRRLTLEGSTKNDPAMIEISLKLADLYARKGDDERAELGFLFCVDSAKENVDKSDAADQGEIFKMKPFKPFREEYDIEVGRYSDPYALYGMVLECYAQYLITKGRCEEAEDYISRCLELSYMIHGPLNSHGVTVLNNFGVLLLDQQRFDRAAYFFGQATYRASNVDELTPRLSDYYCNYAEALWHAGQRDEALNRARLAVELADESGDEEQKNRAREFLAAFEKTKRK